MSIRTIALSILLFLQTCAALITHDCPASSCGTIHNISYPFRLRGDPPHCGDKRYELNCDNNATVLSLFSGKYHVHEIDYKRYKIRVSDVGVVEDVTCSFMPRYFLYSGNFSNFFWDLGKYPLNLDTEQGSIGYLNCANPITDDSRYVAVGSTSCGSSSGYVYAVVKDLGNDFGVKDIKVGCQLKVSTFVDLGRVHEYKHKKNVSYDDIHNMLSRGFGLSWLGTICEDRCGKGKACSVVDESSGDVKCDQPDCRLIYENNQTIYQCDVSSGSLSIIGYIVLPFIGLYKGLMKFFGLNKATQFDEVEVEIGKSIGQYVLPYFIIRASFGVVALVVWLICKWERRHKSDYENIEAFLQGNNLMPIRYSYKEIKHMTRNFKEKLGQGGFGLVYKAKLRGGSFAAVKMLIKSKANGQEFISEVATIGRIHHTNVVRLIGFCVEGSHHALVYEFMSNGSLDKYIFSKQNSISLTYRQIYEISLGVARGIAYLHEGCDMQILHFDIKPHNILLDENFIPKVSDFGLAKLYPTDKSIVTLTAARGTIGYMAPELFYHNIGGVSYKADVYSFGMLLIEMASKRRNLNPNADHSSEIFFPIWIYDQLRGENEIEMEDITKEEYDDEAKRMFLVALWCIQLRPSDRPSINKVVEMLQEELENIEMPPKPLLYPHELIQNNLKNTSNQGSSTDSTGSSSYLEESGILIL